MRDHPITLTDVMLGVYNLGLCSKIPSAQFRFLIGLILKGNSLGFKPVMEITNGEAMAIGGGNSRQSVNRLRQGLCEFTVDDKPILIVVHGEHFKNVSAKYEVNYELLAGNGSIWRKAEPSPSQNYDGTNDGSVDGSRTEVVTEVVTDTVTTPRSDQRRGEEIPPNPPNEVTTSEEPENEKQEGGIAPLDSEEEERTIKKVKHIQDLIYRKWKKQINKPPDISSVKNALREFGGDYKPLVTAITKAANTLNTPNPAAALNLVVTIARNYDSGIGVTDEQLAEREKEIKEMEAGLELAMEHPVENEAFISQKQHVIEGKKQTLARLRG